MELKEVIYMCMKCKLVLGIVVLVVGLLMLLQDLGKISLMGITPWTWIFMLAGIAMISKGACKCKDGKKK
jgi:predicted benzoate:H+ symporter BenE